MRYHAFVEYPLFGHALGVHLPPFVSLKYRQAGINLEAETNDCNRSRRWGLRCQDGVQRGRDSSGKRARERENVDA
jgi:hypothetical protein